MGASVPLSLPQVRMETSKNCVKYSLFLFNLLFALSGLLLIIAGGIIQGAYSQYLDFLGNQFFNTPVFLIIVGCIIFVVAFFGCCGAIKENQCMTITFAVLMGVIFLMEIGAGIAAYKLKGEVKGLLYKNMEMGMANYGLEDHQGVTKTWDVIQKELRCCGTQEYKDWVNTTTGAQGESVPDSCCLADVTGCGLGVLSLTEREASMKVNIEGCLDIFSEQIETNIGGVGGVGIAIACVQLIGMIFAIYLATAIKKHYEDV